MKKSMISASETSLSTPLEMMLEKPRALRAAKSRMEAVTAPEFELAVSDYGQTVCGLAGKGRVSGSQFHPEKSGDVGLTLLKNFLEKRF